jgi:HemX protein
VIHFTALSLYIVAFVLWFLSLLSGARGGRAGLASGAAGAAVLFHAAALVGFLLQFRQLPIVGLGPALSSLAFVLGIGVVGVAFRGEAARIGIVVMPFIVLLQGAALWVGIAPDTQVPGLEGTWFALHVILALVGYQGLTLASSAGLLYLLQFHELKSKRLGKVFHFLPPLATLERLTTVGLRIGFVSMTFALIAGWAWAGRFQGGVHWGNPKISWAILSWVALLVPLMARNGGGARTWRMSVTAVGGFTVVFVVYLFLRLTSTAGPGFL